MNTIVIDHDGVSAFCGGTSAVRGAPHKDIPVADLTRRWFAFPERIRIHWVNYLKPTVSDPMDWTRDDVVKIQAAACDAMMRDNSALLERAKSAEEAAERMRAELAIVRAAAVPAEPPQAAACPGEIPTAELTGFRLTRERLRAENNTLRAENAELRDAERRVSTQLAARTLDLDLVRKDLEEIRSRLRNRLCAPAGNYKGDER